MIRIDEVPQGRCGTRLELVARLDAGCFWADPHLERARQASTAWFAALYMSLKPDRNRPGA